MSFKQVLNIRPAQIKIEQEYKVLCEIAQTALGSIFKAQHLVTKEVIVLKCRQKEITKYKEFLRELTYSYFLSPHPNILNTYPISYETNTDFLFVQELAPFGSIVSSLNSQKGIGEENVKMVISQLSSAIDFMHSKDVVHTDIRAENVLVFKMNDKDWKVKLAGFDKALKSGTLTKKQFMPNQFTPPEVCNALYKEGLVVTPSMDTWSFGVLIIYLLLGSFPWKVANDSDDDFQIYFAWLMKKRATSPLLFRNFTDKFNKYFLRLCDTDEENREGVKYIQCILNRSWLKEDKNFNWSGAFKTSLDKEVIGSDENICKPCMLPFEEILQSCRIPTQYSEEDRNTKSSTMSTVNPVAKPKLSIAIIGQSQFGAEVLKLLVKRGHLVKAVFTIPDKNNKPDILAVEAEFLKIPVFKFPRWRQQGKIIPEVFEQYKSHTVDLNVLPFCSQYIPMDVINFPKHKSIIYHPSLLPRHRGASAINWALLQGDSKTGFSIFWADEGLDTGPILLQRECSVSCNDTVDSIYNRFLYPEGIKAMAEAVQLIADGNAPSIIQLKEGESYDPMWSKKDVCKINWKNLSGPELHNLIRGSDKIPGAWSETNEGNVVTFYSSSRWLGPLPHSAETQMVDFRDSTSSSIVHPHGLLLFGNDNTCVNVKQVSVDGKVMNSCDLFTYLNDKDKQDSSSSSEIDFSLHELAMKESIKNIWTGILGKKDIMDDTDFFKCGAGSMDVVRLVEEVKGVDSLIQLNNENVYMAPEFKDFFLICILAHRGELNKPKELKYHAAKATINGMDLEFPHELFINGAFVPAVNGAVFDTINPGDESVICQVSNAGYADVDKAVEAAHNAFNSGKWREMNARDRGELMRSLADLMDTHREELATLESLDSGAVYTLALKTHIGMSIDTLKYFSGWCDKIHGQTIPINNSRPKSNLTFTRKEPVGVCGIIIPWNYPLMMLAWKVAPCLAAGNTVVIKPAQVSSLTALKFAELAHLAGFPPGVINVISGSGAVIGKAMTEHPLIRKVGFTGSTQIGKDIMKKAMSSVFFNKGENCIAAGRIFVEKSIHDEFVSKTIEEVKKMKIGDPFDRSIDHGPQNHLKHLRKLLEFTQQGIDEGATLVHGGKRVDIPGYFMEPTIFTGVTDDMFIAKEESFGPIMIISTFSQGMDEVIKRANATEFGLASGVITNDINKALFVAEKLDAGTVFVNTYNKTDVAAPFGGFKQSGFGKDLGQEALHEWLKVKTVTIEY